MNNKYKLFLIVVFVYFFINNKSAYAYLDPGTGSIIIQAIIGFIAAGLAVTKIYWSKFKLFLKKIFFKSRNK